MQHSEIIRHQSNGTGHVGTECKGESYRTSMRMIMIQTMLTSTSSATHKSKAKHLNTYSCRMVSPLFKMLTNTNSKLKHSIHS
jgi:hypothetical protein